MIKIDNWGEIPASYKDLLKFCLSLHEEYPRGFSKTDLQKRFPKANKKGVSELVDSGVELGVIKKDKISPTKVTYIILPFKVPVEVFIEMIDEDIDNNKRTIEALEQRKSELLRKKKEK